MMIFVVFTNSYIFFNTKKNKKSGERENFSKFFLLYFPSPFKLFVFYFLKGDGTKYLIFKFLKNKKKCTDFFSIHFILLLIRCNEKNGHFFFQ